MQRLVDRLRFVVIEHNLDVNRCADWLIDLARGATGWRDRGAGARAGAEHPSSPHRRYSKRCWPTPRRCWGDGLQPRPSSCSLNGEAIS